MRIRIRAKKLKLNKTLKNFVHNKVESLTKFTGDLSWAQIEFWQDNRHRKRNIFCVEIQVRLGKNRLITRQSGPDMYSAFDIALDNIASQVRKVKRKRIDKNLRQERKWKQSLKSWRPSIPGARAVKGLPRIPGRVWRRVRRK